MNLQRLLERYHALGKDSMAYEQAMLEELERMIDNAEYNAEAIQQGQDARKHSGG